MGNGKKLKEYIDSKGTNVRKLADKTGISATTLYTIIQKDSDIRLDFALRLADALEIDANEICNDISGLSLTIENNPSSKKETRTRLSEYLQLGEKMKELRKKSGMSQKEMAAKLGLTSATYSNYENGYSEPPMFVIIPFCECLKISVNDLLGYSIQKIPSILAVKENLCNWIASMNMMDLYEFMCMLEDFDNKSKEIAERYLYPCKECMRDHPDCALEPDDDMNVCYKRFCEHYGIEW